MQCSLELQNLSTAATARWHVSKKASTGRRSAGRKFRPVHPQPPDLAARGRPIAASLLPFSYLILSFSTHREKRQGRHGCATTKHRRLALTAALSRMPRRRRRRSPSPSPLAVAAAARRLEHWSPFEQPRRPCGAPRHGGRRSSPR